MQFGAIILVACVRSAQAYGARGNAYGGVAALAQHEVARQAVFPTDGNDGKNKYRNIDNHNADYRWNEVVKEFESLSGVGCHEVEEHVNGYDRVAEEIQQHKLEGGEEDEQEEYPRHLARTTVEGHQQPDGRHGQHYVGNACHQAHSLGEAKRHIGQGKHQYGYKKEAAC